MASITGFGGVFVRTDDPEALADRYARHLGLSRSGAAAAFPAPAQPAEVVFALLGRQDEYVPPGQPVMLNLRVDDLDGVLDRLIEEGVAVDPRRETSRFGRFGWVTDPEGNRVELRQPAAGD